MRKRGSSCYLDSSAVVKMVDREPESAALTRYLATRGRPLSSALTRVEVVRAARRRGAEFVDRAREVLGELDLLAIDEGVLDRATTLAPPALRTLDAIHLASALELGALEIVSYDRRLVEAAGAVGIPPVTPT